MDNSDNEDNVQEQTICSVNEESWCQKTFGAMLDNTDTHDVTFKTSDGGSVSGHRALVAAGSPVFHAMLYGSMKESNQTEIDLTLVVDVETLKVLFTFIYTGAACFGINMCMKLLEAAHYFGVDVLEVRCVECINDTLGIDNCCQIVTFAHSKGFQLLVEKCFSFMFVHAIDFIKSPQFKDMPFDILFTFLESSDIRAAEIDLFVAVVEWYKHQSHELSDITKSIFRLIRYPLISKHDLIHTVKKVKEIDSALYTSALEYHLEPEEYSGDLEQIISREPSFEVISVTPNTVKLRRSKDKIEITRIGASGWKGLCAVKVCPSEGKPVHFGLCLKLSSIDISGIQFVLRSASFDSLACDNHNGGLNAKFLRRGEEMEVFVSRSGSRANAKLGSQSLNVNSYKDFPYYLCIYLCYPDDKLVISYK